MAAVSEPEHAADVCRPFLDALPISGASITAVTSTGTGLTLSSSDTVAARIDELQFELGEGPLWVAAQSGQLTAIVDVAAASHAAWPVLGTALAELPVGSIFCVPILMGAVTVGVATLYSDKTRDLHVDQRITALAIASAIAGSVIQLAMSSAADDSSAESVTSPALRREVHQATGMILVQLNTTATIAYSRMQAYAFANGRTVQAVAHDVVTGSFTFESES